MAARVGSRDLWDGDDSMDFSYELGLERSPFEDALSAYYPVQQWEEHLRFLQGFRAGSFPLLLIPGIVGSGKTALVKRFLELQNDPVRLHYLEAQPHHSIDQLIHTLYQGSGLDPQGDASTPEVLQQLGVLAKEVGSQLLFIDDAHRLPRETLTRLLHLLFAQDADQPQFRVVLLGETQLQETVMNLLDAFASDRQVPSLALEPLSLDQIREYLEFRYAHAQRNQAFPFSVADLKQIHVLSGGFPGRVNRVAQQVFVDTMRADHHAETRSEPSTAFLQAHKMKLFGGALFLALFAVVWQFNPIQHKTSSGMAELRSAVTAAKKTLQTPEFDAEPSVAQNSTETAVADQAAASCSSAPLSQDVREAIAVAVDRLEAGELSDSEQFEAAFSMPVVRNQHLMAGARLSDDTVYLAAESPAHEAVSIPVAPVAQIASTDKATSLAVAAPAPVKHHVVAADSITGAELQLLASQGYTLQIMGVRRPELLDTFMAENKLTDAVYYRTQLNKQDWYVLVYGHFSSAEDAKAALAALPEAVRKQQPWVRSFDGVRQAIEVAHQNQTTRENQKIAAR